MSPIQEPKKSTGKVKTTSEIASGEDRENKDGGQHFCRELVPWNPRGKRMTLEWFQRLVLMLMDFVWKTNDRKEKVLNFQHPRQLMQEMDFTVPDEPQNLERILVDCQDTLKHQVKTGHPRFFNQLSSGLDTISLAGEWLTAVTNANMFTYEIAPVFILMEAFVLKKMREIIGFNDGDSILAPGGSISNLYAVLVARNTLFPKYKKHGLAGLAKPLVAFTSEHCHYSIKSAAMVTGLGMDNCVEVPVDERGRMIPGELERLILKSIAEGKQPFFVNCTAGTTVFGAFDPINPIADVCEKYSLWLHVDGAWGGSLLMSKKYRSPRFDGVHRARSISWNPHKLLTTNLQCATVHFREKDLLQNCNSMNAAYLFQQDKQYDVEYDTGDKVIQCGRRNDIFKFWLQWRAHGTVGFERDIEHLMDLAKYQMERMRSMPDKFHLIVQEPELTNVCFWYVPLRLRKMKHCTEREQILGQVTAKLKEKMMENGTLMIGYQPQGRIPNFFRSVISNPVVNHGDIDFMLQELDRLGRDL